jgi:hypothetical protein
MRRRTLLVVLAGLAVVVAAVAVVLWPRPPSRITRANYDRIRAGMTRAEVETILGPPGDYRSAPAAYSDGKMTDADEGYLLEEGVDDLVDWLGDGGQLTIKFAEFDGTPSVVTGKAYWSTTPQRQSPLDNLLWRAKRQWHRWFP